MTLDKYTSLHKILLQYHGLAAITTQAMWLLPLYCNNNIIIITRTFNMHMVK